MDLQNSLIRYGLLKLLSQEFGIFIKAEDQERAELAKKCIEVYQSPEEFYEATGWARDNPKESEFSYLLEHKICRLVQGEVWYFSYLAYEDGLRELKKQTV